MSIGELLAGREGLRIEDPRQTSVSVHAYLRDLIISGAIPPGTQLKQAELARVLAVSRTPLREAFRMLQEEGLVSAEPNQRSVVLGLDAEALDSLYAARITLESLGARLTAGRMTREEVRSAAAAHKEMDRTYRAGDYASWTVAHRRFHRLLVGRSGAPVLRTISSYAEQSERYVRIDQLTNTQDFEARQREHQAIFDAVRHGDGKAAVVEMARHLSGSARRVVEAHAPGRGTPFVDAALDLLLCDCSDAASDSG
ncbi:transcriptional regulator, GntR family [Pseudonocardia thermophila]|mgnify:CR=1 FL=1|uniref:Transcriptional regulator, GntR family n=1 Tax=Pseudonocardia thermophila TaxID=1848 RepID=A0A1M6PGF2_PSETH|nr:GntR family transcriptional regulator [Pseudonocardia thermophila]SHK07036.1 transcriptional regulator, GntR family [Pseudonocardia thermophila]